MIRVERAMWMTVAAVAISHSATAIAEEWSESTKALIGAARVSDKKAVKAAIKKGADINVRSGDLTPLMIAADKESLAIVKLLLRAGADKELLANGGQSALTWAVQKGNTKIVRELMKAKATVRPMDWTIAIHFGGPAVTKALFAQKGGIDFANDSGVAAILAAADKGDDGTVKKALAAKADPNAKRKDGGSAVFIAAENGHTAIVKQLLAAGADPKVANTAGVTPIGRAVANHHVEVALLLIKKGVDVHGKNPEGFPLIVNAAGSGKAELVQALLDAGADVEAKDKFQGTAIIQAAMRNSFDVAKVLIDAKANVNVKNQFNQTALGLAKSDGTPELVKLLQGAGAVEAAE